MEPMSACKIKCPRQSRGFISVSPSKGKNMKRLKALTSYSKFELVISLIFLFLMSDVRSHHLFAQPYR